MSRCLADDSETTSSLTMKTCHCARASSVRRSESRSNGQLESSNLPPNVPPPRCSAGPGAAACRRDRCHVEPGPGAGGGLAVTRRRRLLARTSRDAPEFLESRRGRRESDLNSESHAAADSESEQELRKPASGPGPSSTSEVGPLSVMGRGPAGHRRARGPSRPWRNRFTSYEFANGIRVSGCRSQLESP